MGSPTTLAPLDASIKIIWRVAPPASTATSGVPSSPRIPGDASWKILGITVSATTATALVDESCAHDAGPPRVCAVHRENGYFTVLVNAPTWARARLEVAPVVLGLVAHIHGLAYICGRLAHGDGEAAPASLVLGGGPEFSSSARDAGALIGVLIDTSGHEPYARAVGSDLLSPDGVRAPVAPGRRLVDVIIAGPADESGYLDPKSTRAHLRSHIGLPSHSVAAVVAGSDGPALLADLVAAAESRTAEIASAVPGRLEPASVIAFRGSQLHAADAGYAALEAPASFDDAQLEALRRMQGIAAGVYGRLEPERALAWMLEEVGELAQAVRRRERDVRIREEIGQVFSWILCMANISGIDLAEAADRALRHEALRQKQAYGTLRPYQPTTPFRDAQ